MPVAKAPARATATKAFKSPKSAATVRFSAQPVRDYLPLSYMPTTPNWSVVSKECRCVFVRGQTVSRFLRRPNENVEAFHARLVRGDADEPRSRLPRADGSPVIVLLYRGDVDLPDGSSAYALFHERVTPSLAASDLLS
jgi:hypothetical protein